MAFNISLRQLLPLLGVEECPPVLIPLRMKSPLACVEISIEDIAIPLRIDIRDSGGNEVRSEFIRQKVMPICSLPERIETGDRIVAANCVQGESAFLLDGISGWPNKDPIGEKGGVNVYSFLGNATINRFDPSGLWTTEVHHQIVDDWLRDPLYLKFPWRNCVLDVRAIPKDASDQVDGVGEYALGLMQAQSVANAYKHAMRGGAMESVENAKKKYEQYYQDSLNEAKRLSDSARAGDCIERCALIKQAVRAIGYAFHALSDGMSPAHKGFQVWDGSIDVGDMLKHQSRENLDVYSELHENVMSGLDSQLTPYLTYVLSIRVLSP